MHVAGVGLGLRCSGSIRPRPLPIASLASVQTHTLPSLEPQPRTRLTPYIQVLSSFLFPAPWLSEGEHGGGIDLSWSNPNHLNSFSGHSGAKTLPLLCWVRGCWQAGEVDGAPQRK